MKPAAHTIISTGGFDSAELPRTAALPLESIQPENASARIRALVVDDESISREYLCRLLRSEPEIELAGAAGGGREALEAIHRLKPDLLFLDVQMPDLDGFEVVNRLPSPNKPAIIFVTANQEFALKAFEVAASDYLVKPCSRDRLRLALRRARAQLQRDQHRDLREKLDTLLRQAQPGGGPAARLAVKAEGRIFFLPLADIDWVRAADNYVELHVGDRTHVVRKTMVAIQAALPTDRFVKINRSAMVNIEKIRELEPRFHGEYAVILRDGTRLSLTRAHRRSLRQLGLE